MASSRRALKLYIHGDSMSRGGDIWYCIDLESLPEDPKEHFFPVFGANMFIGSWTVMGDDIYWAGITEDDHKTSSPVVLGKHNINTSPNPFYFDVLYGDDCERRIFRLSHLITLDGNRILLMDAKKVLYLEDEEDYGDHFMAQIVDLDTGNWRECGYYRFVRDFLCYHKILLRDDQDRVKQVVFYSLYTGMFVFYDVCEDKFREEHHPLFVFHQLDKLPGGLISSTDMLIKVATETTAACMGSTLYWFTHKLCLYGYDFSHQTWFQSPPLPEDKLWELRKRPLAYPYPFLVSACNGNELILIVKTPSSKLGIAFLSVSKLENTLHVIVKSRHTLSIDPTFFPLDGIAMISAATLKTPGLDADSVSSPNQANRIPEDGSSKVVCRCSARSPVIEMNREAQLVDISNGNKGLSLHVEQMKSVYREFELVSQLMESRSMVGVLRAYLSDKETALQNLLEENELLKLGMIIHMGSGSSKISNEAEGDSTEEADKSSRTVACAIEELTAAVAANTEVEELNAAVAADSEIAANAEIETELRRVKLHRDQWRKAAEAMASWLLTGNNKKKYNMWKVSPRFQLEITRRITTRGRKLGFY